MVAAECVLLWSPVTEPSSLEAETLRNSNLLQLHHPLRLKTGATREQGTQEKVQPRRQKAPLKHRSNAREENYSHKERGRGWRSEELSNEEREGEGPPKSNSTRARERRSDNCGTKERQQRARKTANGGGPGGGGWSS